MARMFCTDWTLKQELKLLEALEEYGYGNWPAISQKTGKNPQECKNHYDHYYINRHQNAFPDFSYPVVRTEVSQVQRMSTGGSGSSDDGEGAVYYPGTEIDGYMPRRGDFAHEPDDDAEALIMDLDGDPDHEELISALNLVAIQMYQSRLMKRAFRKRVVRDYGLLDIHRQTAVDSVRLTRHQLRLKNVTRPFLRLMNPEKAASFMQSHFLEDQLCGEIKKLQHYRESGITTIKGMKLYERLLSARKQRKVSQKSLIKKNCSTEENILYQVFRQGPLKSKKQAPKEPKLLDITYSVGVEKLDEQEKELCSLCRLQPEAYLQFKRQLVSECKKLGRLALAEARKLLKIDVNKTRKVYDLLIAKGLINSTTSATT